MNTEIQTEIPILHGKEIQAVLRRAVQHALLMHKRAGNPIAVWQDGKVVMIPPEEIPVADPFSDSQKANDQ
jgi:hypothetical protein